MAVQIYHNPRCSKSRQTLALLEENGVDAQIVEYLKAPPDAATLKTIVSLLGVSPLEIVRRNEEPAKEAGSKLDHMSDGELLDWLVNNPIAIQRPIVVTDEAARIGRPPESVVEILPG